MSAHSLVPRFFPYPAPRAAGRIPVAAPRPETAAVPSYTERTQPFQKAAYVLALVYAFVIFARIPELIGYIVHHNVYLVLLLTPLALGAAFFSGAVFRAARTPVGLCILFFTAWIIMATPFAYWRGGSVGIVLTYLKSSLPAFLIVAGSLCTIAQCLRGIQIIGLAEIVVTMAVLVFGRGDRLGMVFGTLANQNDLAAYLIAGLPFYLMLRPEQKGGPFFRILVMAGAVPISIVVIKTGSRMGLIGLAVVLLVYFMRQKLMAKVAMAVGALVLLPFAWSLLPKESVERYKTIMDSGANVTSGAELSARESREQRKELFFESLRVTAHHPVFGVGPGNFATYTANENTGGPAWRETHNSITQASSEAGIPAMLAYVAILLYTLKMSWRIYRRTRNSEEHRLPSRMAFTLFASMLGFAVCCVFGNYAYTFPLPLLSAIVTAFVTAMRTAAPATVASRRYY